MFLLLIPIEKVGIFSNIYGTRKALRIIYIKARFQAIASGMNSLVLVVGGENFIDLHALKWRGFLSW
ncbi:hypothetical protein LCGC14_0747020 [marine sediment metagenome]|uniref:Uncharacterized protein n=1 Tax=marine sediment metagenome TaxID=412755 RepID=A0A0F9Q513_9ZZZZ